MTTAVRREPGVPGAQGVPGTDVLAIYFEGDIGEEINQMTLVIVASEVVATRTLTTTGYTIQTVNVLSNFRKQFTKAFFNTC